MISGNLGYLSLCIRHRCLVFRFRALSSASSQNSNGSNEELTLKEEAAARADAYRQLEDLNFHSAAKILFTTPPKRKKFGIDFHLVQLFFACLPSLAVYLVALYARSEIRRMEAEVEKKKKIEAEEEERLKNAELISSKEESNNELSEVMLRLNVLEETVRVIADEKKNSIVSNHSTNQKPTKMKAEPFDHISDSQNRAKELADTNCNITQKGKLQ